MTATTEAICAAIAQDTRLVMTPQQIEIMDRYTGRDKAKIAQLTGEVNRLRAEVERKRQEVQRLTAELAFIVGPSGKERPRVREAS